MTYFGPNLDPRAPLGEFGPKVNTNVMGHGYCILTRFGKYLLSDSVAKAFGTLLWVFFPEITAENFLRSLPAPPPSPPL